MTGNVRHPSGVVRSDASSKPDIALVDFDMVRRWGSHMARNAEDKGRNNWRNASTQEDLERFVAGALRHALTWAENILGYTEPVDDEDHGAAVFFNVSGAEHAARRIKEKDGPVGAADPDGVFRTFVDAFGPNYRRVVDGFLAALHQERLHFRLPTKAYVSAGLGDFSKFAPGEPLTLWGVPLGVNDSLPANTVEFHTPVGGGSSQFSHVMYELVADA